MNMYVKHSFAMDEREIESIIISYINEPKNFYKNNMIKRYVKFIFACKNKNKKDRSIIHIESHHILPKSIWNEYKDFSYHRWNQADLSLRQHFIAHYMLYKIFGGKMTYALYQMVPQSMQRYEGTLSTKDMRYISSRHYNEMRIAIKEERKGYATYKDENNKTYFLHRDDPLIKIKCLVPHLTGFRHSDKTKKKMEYSRSNGRGYKIRIYFMCYKKYVHADELNLYYSYGWDIIRNNKDNEYITEIHQLTAAKGGKATSVKYNGMIMHYYQDGSVYGYLSKDDPIIKELNLTMDKRSKKMLLQRQKRSVLAKKANTGAVLYNNGVIQLKFKDTDEIPDGFVKGVLSRNLVKGHTKKYDWENKENQQYIITLLKKHNGSLNKVGNDIGISGTNVLLNLRKYMPTIDHTEYFTRLYKYQNDKVYKDKIDNLYKDPIDRIKYIDIDEYNNVIDIRNKIINSGINLNVNGWITKVTLLLAKPRKFVVRFMQSYMIDVDVYW